jgi:hypothetical protein
MPIPYARAEMTGTRYGVRCPKCDVVFIGTGKTEDAITKSANRSYAKHYEATHANEPDRPIDFEPDRVLLDDWNDEAFSAHLHHGEFGCAPKTPEVPETCDHCYVRPMLASIYEVWMTSTAGSEVLWSMQNGYGEIGFMPDQGYDWSGIRDSTPHTIREMYRAIHA